jgi:AcrR family transcriptional regulator
MSPRTQEQFEKIRGSRRQQIMETALGLFASEGYEKCSISLLAETAGISKGLMYNYFKSKESLLSSIIDEGLKEIMDLFDPNHDGVLTSAEMESFIRRVFAAMRGNLNFWSLYISVLLQPKVKEMLSENQMMSYLERFTPILTEYFERKGFEDPRLEMLTLSALIEGFGALMIYAYPAMIFPDELFEKFQNRIIGMYK